MKRFLLRLILIIILIPTNLYSQVNDSAILADPPPKLLSEYGFFLNTKDQITPSTAEKSLDSISNTNNTSHRF